MSIDIKKAVKLLKKVGTTLTIAPGDKVATSYQHENSVRVRVREESDDDKPLHSDMSLPQFQGRYAVQTFKEGGKQVDCKPITYGEEETAKPEPKADTKPAAASGTPINN